MPISVAVGPSAGKLVNAIVGVGGQASEVQTNLKRLEQVAKKIFDPKP
jgi:hypothetical protein